MVANSVIHHSDITDVLYLLISVSHHLQLKNNLQSEYQKTKTKEARRKYKHAAMLVYRLNYRLQAHRKALEEITKILRRSADEKQVIVLDGYSAHYADIMKLQNGANTLLLMQDILNSKDVKYSPKKTYYKPRKKTNV